MDFRVIVAGERPSLDVVENAHDAGVSLEWVRAPDVLAALSQSDSRGYVMNSFGWEEGPKITSDLLNCAPGLRFVTYMGASRELADYAAYVDADAVRRCGIPFTSTATADFAVAESAMALLHALELNLVHVHNSGQHPGVRRGLYGASIGIVGMGQLGRQVAALTAPLGMSLIYHSRNRKPEVEERYGAQWRPLRDLFAETNHVTVHLPGSAPDGLIGSEVLQAANGIHLINTPSAPQLIDPAALLKAFERGNVSRAAIEDSYPAPYSEQLRALGEDALITLPAYTSWDTWNSRSIGWRMVLETCAAAATGAVIPHRLL